MHVLAYFRLHFKEIFEPEECVPISRRTCSMQTCVAKILALAPKKSSKQILKLLALSLPYLPFQVSMY